MNSREYELLLGGVGIGILLGVVSDVIRRRTIDPIQLVVGSVLIGAALVSWWFS
jgi:hypothetical protein